MTINDLKNKFVDIAKKNKITMSMMIAHEHKKVDIGKKLKKALDQTPARVYVEIQSHMTVGKFEVSLEAANRITPDVLDAQILFGLKKAYGGEVHRVL